jgi:hypothetical protein
MPGVFVCPGFEPTPGSGSGYGSVGAAEGCDLLILIVKKQNQKIAAFGSSYRGICGPDSKKAPIGAFLFCF